MQIKADLFKRALPSWSLVTSCLALFALGAHAADPPAAATYRALDDKLYVLGTDNDYQIAYDSGDNRVEIRDAAGNVLGRIADAGTTGTVGFTQFDVINGSYASQITSGASANRAVTLPDAAGEISLLGQTIATGEIVDGTIVNADVSASAAIVPTKFSAGTDGQVIVTASSASGWGTVPSAGITDGTIVNADINASAGIAVTKLSTSGASTDYVLTYNGSAIVWAAPASVGDISAGSGIDVDNLVPRMDGVGSDTLQGYTSNDITASDAGLLSVPGGINASTGTIELEGGNLLLSDTSYFKYARDNEVRWDISYSTGAESGASGETSLKFTAYDNDGNALREVMKLNRTASEGVVFGSNTAPSPIYVKGDIYAHTSDAQIVDDGKVLLAALAQTSATTGQSMVWDGTKWAPSSVSVNWGSPGAIGSSTPNSGVFTSLTAASLDLGTPLPDSEVADTQTIGPDSTVAHGALRQDAVTGTLINALLNRQYHAYVTVSGSVDTTVAGITDASPTKRYCVYVPNGTYTDEAVVCKDYVDIIGESRDGVVLSSSSQTDETVDVAGADTLIANLTITHTTNIGQTRQYPIHADTLGTVRNSVFVLYNVAATMLGTYVPISADTHGAIGIGIFGTQRMYLVDVVADGNNLPGIWVHNDASESEPTGVYLINCTASSDALEGFRWGNTGSGQDDSVVIVGGSYTGDTDDILVEDISGGAGEVFIYVDPSTTGEVTVSEGTQLEVLPFIPVPVGYVNGPAVFAGPVEFGTDTQNINLLTINGAAGTYRGFYVETGGLGRWRIATDIVAESGSQVGGDLIFTKYNDAGSSNGNVLILSRETGLVTVGNSLSVLSNGSFSGTFGANGNVTLGDASTDAHVLNGTLTTNQNLAGFNLWANYNSNTGTTGQSIILVGNESANQNAAVRLIAHGTGFTTLGAYKQDAGALAAENALSDGLSIIARHTSGDVRVYAGGGADGDLVVTYDDAQLATYEGAVSIKGNMTFGDASTDTITLTARTLLTSVTDAGPMTATAGTERQIVYNESDSKVYVCTVTGSPATWVALH